MIYITGSSGQIGRSLVSKLETIDLALTKIHHADYRKITFPQDKNSVLVHLGWETRNRSRAVQEQCRVESYDLISKALAAEMRVIYISSDSALSTTRSNYGQAKFKLQDQFNSMNVTCVRIGFVDFPSESKNYIKIAVKIFNHNLVIPRLIRPELRMRVTPHEKLIESLLELIHTSSKTILDLPEIHRTYALEEYLLYKSGRQGRNLPLQLPVPSGLVLFLLRVLSSLRGQRTNWHDSFLGLVDSSRKADLND